MAGRSYLSGVGAKEGYTGKERDAETGLDYFGARYYLGAIGRWGAVDALTDQYPSWSPYTYVLNSPLRLVDPNGQEIQVCSTTSYTDANGEEQQDQECTTYSVGMQYQGTNTFIQKAISALNAIVGTENGSLVLATLIQSKNVFNFSNSRSSQREAFSFIRSQNGGGTINIGGIEQLSDERTIGSIAHESYHAYQHENGYSGASVNSEVEAYLFENGISISLGLLTRSLERSGRSDDAIQYGAAVNSLLYDDRFDQAAYNNAILSFKGGSSANATGLYSNFPVHPISTNPLIKAFFPLIK
jgi:RHS repeat-associated protein